LVTLKRSFLFPLSHELNALNYHKRLKAYFA